MRKGYSRPARLLHWGLAVVILAMLPIGGIMVGDDLPRAVQNMLFIIHKNLGVAILGLMLLRLAYRLAVPPTPLPAHLPRWQVRAAGATHVALYGLVLFMALTGYIRVTMGGFPIESLAALGLHPLLPRNETIAELAKAGHYYGRYALVAVLGLHIAAALHHALVLRDGVFGRIWPLTPR